MINDENLIYQYHIPKITSLCVYFWDMTLGILRKFSKIQQSAYRSTIYSLEVSPESSNEYFCLVFGKSASLISLLVHVVAFLSLFISLSEKQL